MKILWLFALVVCCWALSPVILLAQAPDQKLKIGVVVPLSGGVAAWGNDVRNVLLFANKQLTNNSISLIFEDDVCLGKNAVTAAQKLTSVDHVDAAMVACTESMLSSAPIFEKAKTLVITPVASAGAVASAGDYIFRTWPGDAAAAKLLFDHIAAKGQPLAMLTEERGYSEELAKSFLSAAAGSSLAVINESFSSDTTDFRSLLTKLRAAGSEALLINTNTDRAFVNILKQAKDLGWTPAVYGAYMPGNAAFIDLAGALAEGVIYVDAPSADSTLGVDGKTLYQEFVHEYGSPHSSSFIFGSTYEAFKRIIELPKDRSEWRSFLYTGKFTGIFGEYSFDVNGDIEGVAHVLKVIRDGKPRDLSE